ncbi:MAG: hypothetical protein U9R74_04125 [Pseudomonadota bacterium]|nr:hypothetical protein [Pseudomonadota bacterium]
MPGIPTLLDLRRRLALRLRELIANPGVEEKELAAFDLLVSRRTFLKTAEVAVLANLVNSTLVPSAWGACDPSFEVDRKAVGLSEEDEEAIGKASRLTFGTETFQDTINSHPVVALDQPFLHGLIEGARARMRIQSQLKETSPLELQFLDRGFHFGPAELIQLEKDDSDQWELVHYYHPWQPRQDGGRTDGLERHVIMQQSEGLTDPTRIICVTGSHTNEFGSVAGGVAVNAAYMIYVEQNNGLDDGFVVMGYSQAEVEPPFTGSPAYGVTWAYEKTSKLNLPPGTDRYLLADKYTNAGMSQGGQYTPIQATEHVVIYLTDVMKIVTLDDVTNPGIPNLVVHTVPYPTGVSAARFTHIEFDPVQSGDYVQVSDFAVTTVHDLGGGKQIEYRTYTNEEKNAIVGKKGYQPFGGSQMNFITINYKSDTFIDSISEPLSVTQERPDYSSLINVNGLFNASIEGTRGTLHLKLGNFPGSSTTYDRGLCLFVMHRTTATNSDRVKYFIAGDYPLATPDVTGRGRITNVSGGVSKFGGFRLFASDDRGNLLMLRQKRLPETTTPYTPPIYIQNNVRGEPIDFSNQVRMDVPDGTSEESNLYGLNEWMEQFPEGVDHAATAAYNILLNTLAGFGTDERNLSQAVWLGTGFEAVYAPKRFAHDGHHVAVRSDEGSGGESFGVFNVFNNPVDKTWRSRQIARQVTPEDEGVQLSGDFFEATITPANAYGQSISLSSPQNEGLQVEVRADSPCEVVDQTSNNYYDVDRYTSFLAGVDPGSGKVRLAVKATTFSQILYARLVQTAHLAPSADPAMLDSTSGALIPATDWVQINLAAEAQQRMAMTANATLSGAATRADGPSPYVTAATLSESFTQNDWQMKETFKNPGKSDFDSLAAFMNSSGQSLFTASSKVTPAALAAAGGLQPLTAMTNLSADVGRTPNVTSFLYKDGAIAGGGDALPVEVAVLGGVFSSIGHKIHDALHWLQHAEHEAYRNLSKGVTIVIDETEQVTVTISKDIMKAVNGVEETLATAVSTVEEYASIVVNVIVTIVVVEFIFSFIGLLIALISLFVHLKDIENLSKSFKSLFRGLFNPDSNETPELPKVDTSFPFADLMSKFSGKDNCVDQDMLRLKSSDVTQDVIKSVLGGLMSNPFFQKILGDVLSVAMKAENEVTSSLPFSFNISEELGAALAEMIDQAGTSMGTLSAKITQDLFEEIIDQITQDIENPKKTFPNLANGMSDLMDRVGQDVVGAMDDVFSEMIEVDLDTVRALMTEDDFFVVEKSFLVDLLQLFGIGNVSGGKLRLSAEDAVFFPLSMMIWVSIFMTQQRSISSYKDLSTPTESDGELGGSLDDLTFASLVVTAAALEIAGLVWAFNTSTGGDYKPKAPNLGAAFGSWINLIHWIFQLVVLSINAGNRKKVSDLTVVLVVIRLLTAFTAVWYTLPKKGHNTVEDFSKLKRTDIMLLVNTFVTIVVMVAGASRMAQDPDATKQDRLLLIGKDIAWGSLITRAVWTLAKPPPDSDVWFAAFIAIMVFPIGVMLPISLSSDEGSDDGRERGQI